MHRWLKNKNTIVITVSLLIVCILFLCGGFFYVLNKTLQNQYYLFKNNISHSSASQNIIIAEIDEKTIDTLGSFPFSRDVYAQTIENLQQF